MCFGAFFTVVLIIACQIVKSKFAHFLPYQISNPDSVERLIPTTFLILSLHFINGLFLFWINRAIHERISWDERFLCDPVSLGAKEGRKSRQINLSHANILHRFGFPRGKLPCGSSVFPSNLNDSPFYDRLDRVVSQAIDHIFES